MAILFPSIKGRALDDQGAPQSGLPVELWYFHHIFGLRRGNKGTTAADGTFDLSISVFTDPIIPTLFVNDAHIRIKSKTGPRLLFKSTFHDLVSPGGSDVDLGDIALPRTTLSGWRITNLDPAGAFGRYTENNLVSPVLDNDVAWGQRLLGAVRAAQSEMNFLLFYFSVEDLLIAFTPDPPAEGVPTSGVALENEIVFANRKSPPRKVRIVPRWAFLPLNDKWKNKDPEPPFLSSSAARIRNFFQAAQPNSVEVREYRCEVRVPMHAKLAVFDGKVAHLMGSPLEQQYFDGQEHKFDDARRGRGGNIRVPIHDVGATVEGQAAKDLRDAFVLHWINAGGEDLPSPPPPPVTANANVQVAMTLPGRRFTDKPEGETGIWEAYLRVLEQAKDFVYLENQYFVERTILEAIWRALDRNKSLQVIALINSRVDMQPYNRFQKGRLPEMERTREEELIELLTKDGNNSRFGLFCLWGHEERAPRHRLVRHYIHSKVAIADDKWATIGSANLDGVSLNRSEHFLDSETPKSQTADVNKRATEINVLLFDGLDGMPATDDPVPAQLRRMIWSEHLGADADLTTKPADGWLSLWKARADAKVAGLKANPPQKTSARILRWTPQKDATEFMKAHDVPVENFDIREAVRDFDFLTGRFIGN